MARVTVYDVAEKAGVSTATVSFAFRHPDKVKDDTKAKVLRVAEELGYVPSGNARSLAKGRTGTLGMYAFDMLLERPQGSNLEDDWPDVSPRSIDEPLDGDEPIVLVFPLYVDEVLRGFELECWKSGKGMLMGAASKKNDHRSVTDIAGRVDGLALMPSEYNDTLPLSMLAAFDVIRLLEETGVRVPDDVIVTGFDGILAGRLMEPQLTTVRQPMEDMGRKAARMLLSRNGEPWEKAERRVFPVRLIVRGSCGCNQKI